jgi:hypothetical protein
MLKAQPACAIGCFLIIARSEEGARSLDGTVDTKQSTWRVNSARQTFFAKETRSETCCVYRLLNHGDAVLCSTVLIEQLVRWNS